ncbi:MAG: bifunctional 5,10-methylene-tetrahydrofolate dehydrogenase/5,10-methylene-tetrahydrofolate cyclohydrolase [Flavobacteriales bacterium]|nr:bifunctional 5,10-methylene-tetrahydrofolate dehydrogenase/5,10-methylene-tetrahydrofolate cyclohydrolase [Flavobacteriales bacterium]|tara:strand:+ start:288 stop:1169 length:882 start_codon:yes stop_codon:yes gene_type:complete
MQILDGRKTSASIKDELKAKVAELKKEGKKVPHLAAVLVGEDGGSITYVNAKVKACDYVGYDSTLIRFPDSISEEELLSKVDELNNDKSIDGFIVQLPLPKHIDERKVTLAIDPAKDVDGFHPENIGRMSLGLPSFLPATPNGIMELLKRHNIQTEGKHCVIIGRSSIVGTPLSILMSRNDKHANATVTLCHSRTKNLEEICRDADILVAAIGKPYFVKENMVKDGAVVIDVGTSRLEDSSKKSGYKLAGDVAFDEVAEKCSFITPVPGGVGPMTIASLLLNTYEANKRFQSA